MPPVRRLATVLACLVVGVVAAPAGAAVPLTTLEGSLSVVHADPLEEAHDGHDEDHEAREDRREAPHRRHALPNGALAPFLEGLDG